MKLIGAQYCAQSDVAFFSPPPPPLRPPPWLKIIDPLDKLSQGNRFYRKKSQIGVEGGREAPRLAFKCTREKQFKLLQLHNPQRQ